jgi:hypothetical protein
MSSSANMHTSSGDGGRHVAPVTWPLGKVPSGNTSTHCLLTQSSDAEIDNGSRAGMKTGHGFAFPAAREGLARLFTNRRSIPKPSNWRSKRPRIGIFRALEEPSRD